MEDETYFNIKNLKYKQKLIYDDSPLTEEEADLIAMFRPLPFREREDIFELVYFKYKKCVKKKTKSIYWMCVNTNTNNKILLQSSEAQNKIT